MERTNHLPFTEDRTLIQLTDKYAIKSDSRQWILCKKIKVYKSYPDGWKPYKFYHSLEFLLNALEDILLRESPYESFNDLSSNLSSIRELLKDKIEVRL